MRKYLLITISLFISLIGLPQVDFELSYQHNGRYDFTMIGASFNSQRNNNQTIVNCNELELSPGDLADDDLNLEADQTIIAAYLYWSSNINGGDNSVTLNGNAVFADRIFTDNWNGFTFSGGVADVSSIVTANGTGTYWVDDLQINRPANGSCGTSYGGWVLAVVYEDPDFALNSVNLYDGFRGVTSNNGRPGVVIDITDLLVANEIGSYLGIVAWEGDDSLGGQTGFPEVVEFNGTELGNALNPEADENLFNETNSFANEQDFFNMDMDRFEIDDLVDVGDTSADIFVNSSQDLVVMNVIAFTLGNELPEPTVDILTAESDCEEAEINFELAVNNFNANDILPAGTTVKLYIDVVDSTPDLEIFTTVDLPIGGTENLAGSLPYPPGDPDMITLFATVNLDNAGEPILLELNSNNNRDNQAVDIAQPPQISVGPIESCDNGTGFGNFDFDALISEFESTNPTITISIHETIANAEMNIDPLTGIFTTTENPQTVFARQFNTETLCEGVVEIELRTLSNPILSDASLDVCSNTTTGDFTLTDANNQITTEAGISITYHETLLEAEEGTGALPVNYPTVSTTVFARGTNNSTGCFSISEVVLTVFLNPVINTSVNDEDFCQNPGGNGLVTFDLTTKETEILNGQDPSEYAVNFFETMEDADMNTDAIPNPDSYTTISNPQTIFYTITNTANTSCFSVGSFEVSVFDNPPANDVPISVPTCSNTPNAIFNLLDVALEAAADDPTMIVEFYETELDAENSTNIIMNPELYETPSTVVYGKVIDPTTLCFSIGEVDLQVLGIPEVITGLSVENCATNDQNDQSEFNLENFTATLIGSQANVTITYHTNALDAESGMNPITDPSNATLSSGTVFARSEADYLGNICHSISEIAIVVNPRPIANDVIFQLCSNGLEQVFDLSTQVDLVTGGIADRTVKFYNTLTGAENDDSVDQITSPITSPSATVFVRVENNLTGCFEVNSLDLQVIENPEIDLTIQRVECRIDEIATFDLEEIVSTVGDQFPGFVLSLHETEADANNATNSLGNSIQTSESRNIFLRYQLAGTDCYSVNEVQLQVTETPLQDFGQVVICLTQGYRLPNGEQVTEPGEYFRVIPDPIDGCDILTRTELIVGDIEFPTAFAPNGNSVNDTFRALPGDECVGEVTDFHLVVWNRWGEKVYESRDFLESWDGRHNGQLLDGIYLWRATYTFLEVPTEREGTVALIF